MRWRDQRNETKSILEWLEDPRVFMSRPDLRNTIEIVSGQPFRFTGAVVTPEVFDECVAYASAHRSDFDRFELSDGCLVLHLDAKAA